MRANKMFWGILLLSLGALIIIQQIFNIDLPIIRILFGIFIMYLGAKLIFGSFDISINGFSSNSKITDSTVLFAETNFKSKTNENNLNKKYSTVFGQANLDLSELNESDLKEEIKIENVFGKTYIKTNSNTPVSADISVAFGSVKIRDQKLNAFGSMRFNSPNFNENQPYLKLKIECAFGEVIVN
jgi:predicted membrane protein